MDVLDFANKVKAANDIVDVIGSYLELRRNGANFKARCPFHGEKTPSFIVSPQKQIFKCFGCGESGDVVKFLMKYESMTWWEAVEFLARRANIPIPERNDEDEKAAKEKKRKRDLYIDICRQTAVFYYKALRSPVGKVALDYIHDRGFNDETLRKFGFGYSPGKLHYGGNDMTVDYLKQAGFKLDDCVGAGVLMRSEHGYFDPLANRLIIPIFDMQGRVIAFGGRGITEREISRGKYKNTNDTLLFNKRYNLYGLNIAKEQKQQNSLPNLVVVEGYMDVISMYQAGFRRAVASMGTSLTKEQARWMSRLTDTVYICYDGDAAGQHATVRGMDILDNEGLQVRVMTVPDNLDPDEYIQAHGRKAFEQLIDKALPLPDYKLKLLDSEYPINSTDSVKRNEALPKYVNGALEMLRQLDDSRRQRYIVEVCNRTGYSEDFIRRKLADGGTVNVNEQPVSPTQAMSGSPEQIAKYFVLAALLNSEDYAKLAATDKPLTDGDMFLDKMYDYVLSEIAEGRTPRPDMVYTVCPDATEQQLKAIVECDFTKERHARNAVYFDECVKVVRIEKLRVEREKLLAAIKQNPSDVSLLTKLSDISNQINTLK